MEDKKEREVEWKIHKNKKPLYCAINHNWNF